MDRLPDIAGKSSQFIGSNIPPALSLEATGVARTIQDTVAFWRRRRPEIGFDVALAPECEGLPAETAQTICRIVQEGVSNAVRHAAPTRVVIVVERTRGRCSDSYDIVVKIADDGCGMATSQRVGHGLRGIGERVSAVGGSLTLSNLSGAGLALTAMLPWSPSADGLAAAGASEP